MTVLVTGGSGFLGKRLEKLQPKWIFLSSQDYNLADKQQCHDMINDIKPSTVVHLAAKVGGIQISQAKQAEFFYLNTQMNTNLVHQCALGGVKRLLAALSTCAYPAAPAAYPFTEKDFYSGPPPNDHFAYAMSKRHLHTQCNMYREQYGLNYSTFCPSNIYGPQDHFGNQRSHFVASLIKKVAAAQNGSILEFFGDGRALRQQLYIDDLAAIIPVLLDKHNTDIPLIVAPTENLSINKMIEMLLSQVDKELEIVFNGRMCGQFRKDGSNQELLATIGDFEFTSFTDGVRDTYKWYVAQ